MDVLDDILASLRLSGGVVIDAEFTGDYCVRAQFTPDHCAPFFPLPETLIGYHYIRSGRAIFEVDGQPPVTLGPGGIAILPRNDPHLLSSRTGLPPAEVSEVGWITADGVHRVTTGSDGPKTEVWCGFLGTAKMSEHPLLDALPAMLTLDVSGGEAEWLDSSMRFLAEEHPSPEIVARLAELFLSQAIREYVDRLPPGSTGWLRGLTDPAVSKALSIIHKRFAEDLEVEELAREVGVSRTVLGERFVELLGEPPMRYCGRWRMRMAANMLRDGKHNTANVAYSVGFNSEAAFNRAFKREFGVPPATWRRRVEAEEAAQAKQLQRRELPEQRVKYCRAADGTNLAYSVVGKGPPLIKTANWLNHIEHDWKSPLWRHWIEEFTLGRTLIRYDERGNGLSDWDAPELSLDAFVNDLETVADCLELEQFDLFAISQGAAVSVAYAVRHPERVRRLVILNGYALGWAHRNQGADLARREAMLTLTETSWGADNPAYRQLFTNIYIPEATPKQMGWFNEMQRLSASPENAVRLQQTLSKLDVRELLPKVTVPTLVFHSKDDQAVPFAQGEALAAGIPNAQFIPLESKNHILLESEPAWTVFSSAARKFLDEDEWRVPAQAIDVEADTDRQSAKFGSCKGADGVHLAFASFGAGFPIVQAPNAFTHLEHAATSPIYSHWISEWSRSNRLVCCDMRGFGMSEWDGVQFSVDAIVDDIAAVIEAAGIEECDLLGLAHGAAGAIAYAARHPERVRKLVLVNSFAAGWAVRGDPDEMAWRQSLIRLNEKRWKRDGVVLGEQFVSIYFPGAAPEIVQWHSERLQEIGTAENLKAMLEWGSQIDVRDDLAKVEAPALIFHAKHDANAAVHVGQAVADGIRGSRFIELESANHFILGDEPAWPALVREMREFLDRDERRMPAQPKKVQAAPRHCQARDGTKLAYSLAGEGFPLVKVPNWFNHLERDCDSPIWSGWFEELARERQLLWFDGRGHGASDWDAAIAPDSFEGDLADIVDAEGLERFDLLGIGHGAAVSLAYAVRHPERVRRIVMCNGWSVGWARRGDAEDIERRRAIIKLSGIGWDAQTPLYREIYTKIYIPGGTATQKEWLNEAQRLCTTPENAVAIQEVMGEIDISGIVGKVGAPCLLFHARGDQAVPFECGEQLAAQLNDVRFKPLDSDNHIYVPTERAWSDFTRELGAFLAA
jgi:pimeloyl-ACP methyl ester carboxylesterase/AraC-like DNA-binding protein